MPNMQDLSPLASATSVVQKLQQAGYAACFAGGSVRDQLLGRPVKDYDIATSALPAQVLKIFPKARRVGAAFGVVLVNFRGHAMEVATFRTDGEYADGRRPKEVQFADARADAQRRDFTCNGLFLDPLTGQIMDYVGGRQDIDGKMLRAIGDPMQRFKEDHLRMLRAVRFASRLEFTIHPDTWAGRAFAGGKRPAGQSAREGHSGPAARRSAAGQPGDRPVAGIRGICRIVGCSDP